MVISMQITVGNFWLLLGTCTILIYRYFNFAEILPHMRKQGGGSIVNISSVQGKIAIPYRSACKCYILYCTHTISLSVLNSFALAQQTILKIGNIKSKFSNIYTSIAQPNQIILNDIVCNILFTIAMTTHTWYIYRCSFQTCSTGIL